jgi:hypothetical protein
MRSRVTFRTVFASISVDFKSTETEPNRNFNDSIPELSIRFDLISKVKIESINSVRNRIIAKRNYKNAIFNENAYYDNYDKNKRHLFKNQKGKI